MPKIKSAIKRVEVAKRNQTRNRTWKSAIRTAQNAVAEHVNTAKGQETIQSLNELYKVIDTAVVKGILHKSTAARKKSRAAKTTLKLANKKK